MQQKKQNIIILQAAIFILLPILSLIFDLYTISDQPEQITIAKYLKLKFLPFYDYLEDSFRIPRSFNEIFFLSKINALFYFFIMPILSIIGIIRYRRGGSLRVLHGLALLVFFITLPYLSFIFFANYSPSYIGIGLAIIRFINSVILLLYSRSKMRIVTSSDEGEAVNQQLPKRFLNLVLDQLLLIFLTFETSGWIYSISHNYLNNSYSRFVTILQITYCFVLLIYYFVAEGIFKTTFGKIVSNSSIINAGGEFISVGNAFARTLCRFIPFDNFSFLFGQRGWHDSLSNTYVVKSSYEKDEPIH